MHTRQPSIPRRPLPVPARRGAAPRPVMVLDLETVPDLAVSARMHGLDPSDESGAATLLGRKFPKLPIHRIVCIVDFR